jgi:hypothetical protein
VRYAKLCLAYIYSPDYGDGALEVPLLCLYWYENSDTPSTVIVLDSTVVLTVEKEYLSISTEERILETLTQLQDLHYDANTEELLINNHFTATSHSLATHPGNQSELSSVISKSAALGHKKYFFEVRHAGSKENFTLPITRSFATLTTRSRDEWVFRISETLLTYNKAKQQRRKSQLRVVEHILRSQQKFPACIVDQAWRTLGVNENSVSSQERMYNKVEVANAKMDTTKKLQLSVIDPVGSAVNGAYGNKDNSIRVGELRTTFPLHEARTPSIPNSSTLSVSQLDQGDKNKLLILSTLRPPILPIKVRPSSPCSVDFGIVITHIDD